MNYKFLLIFFFISFLPLVFNSNAATDEVDFTITIHLFDDKLKVDLEGFILQIYEDGKARKKVNSVTGGIAKFFLKVDKEYKIVFLSKDDYVAKHILFDTRNIDLVNWKYKATGQVSLKYDIDVRLFKSGGACQDFSFLDNEAVMIMKYDTEYDDFHDFAQKELETKIKAELKKKC